MAPATKHHKIVALEAQWTPMPAFELPEGHTFELVEYQRSTAEEAVSRIADATIIVTTIVRLDAHALSEAVCPRLGLIALMASGSDCLDLPMCRRRGITVSSCKGANVVAVSEHALSMGVAARRRFGLAQRGLRANDWVERGMHSSFSDADGDGPPSWGEEVLGLVGYGDIGRRTHEVASLLGMQVLVAGRKGATPADAAAQGRVPFTEVLARATLIVCCLPKTPETVDLIAAPELRAMRRNAVVVNVSRGGIVNEDALLDALRARQIFGAGLDVWAAEPSGPVNTALLRADAEDLNLIATPHTAWYAEKTFKNYKDFIKENVYMWCAGTPVRVVA